MAPDLERDDPEGGARVLRGGNSILWLEDDFGLELVLDAAGDDPVEGARVLEQGGKRILWIEDRLDQGLDYPAGFPHGNEKTALIPQFVVLTSLALAE